MLEILHGTPLDLTRCLNIRHDAFAYQAPSTYTIGEVRALLDRDEAEGMSQMIADGQLFVAKYARELVGLGAWRGKNVYNLYVDARYMRRGIGTKLLVAIEDQFQELTTHETLCVDAAMYTKPFYQSQGYELIREAVSSDGLAYLEMQKRLR
jgi:ribosomal protein S18 acetylase RimI-like enzyme